jgi:hypothetical protein
MIKPVEAQLPPRLFIEIRSFGGGTQNRTGVHGFADTLMISNSIFFNEKPCEQFDVLFAESNLASIDGQMASSGIDRLGDLMSGKPTI